jgi:5-methylcytosine-specific restriction endonuclease McrA
MYGRPAWLCRCDCGKETTVAASNLTSGRQKSCGCLNEEMKSARNAVRRVSDEHKREIHRRASREWASRNRKGQYGKVRNDPERWAALLAAGRKWAKDNPEKRATYTRNCRAKRRMAKGKHTQDDVVRILAAQKSKCAICKTPVRSKYHVDHIIPIARGGSNGPENIQILCGGCNTRKWAHDPIEHMQSLGFLV